MDESEIVDVLDAVAPKLSVVVAVGVRVPVTDGVPEPVPVMVPVSELVADDVAERVGVVVGVSGIKETDAVFELVREEERVVDGLSPKLGSAYEGANVCVAVTDEVGDFEAEIVDEGVPLVESEPVPVWDAVIDGVGEGVFVSLALPELLGEIEGEAPLERVAVGVTVLEGVFVGVPEVVGEPESVSVDDILGVPVLELVSVGVAVIDEVPVIELEGLPDSLGETDGEEPFESVAVGVAVIEEGRGGTVTVAVPVPD